MKPQKLVGLLILLLCLAACRTFVNPLMNGNVQGNYRYSAELDGVPSTIKVNVLFDVKATFQGDNGYSFTGTVNLQGEQYRIVGTEIYPAGVKNWELQQTEQTGFQAEVFAGDKLIFNFCSQASNAYGRNLVLDVYMGSESGCNGPSEKLGEIDFRYD